MSDRYPLIYPRMVELDPAIGGLELWKPWNSTDGAFVGWVACFDDGKRWFCYMGIDPDDPTQLVTYEGSFGIPGADRRIT